ncbi:hypothetical protein VI817_000238 [Penicillium citrinum]|nr:hypothetical protein VI817_000238 [Penicillium citrinum]
MACLTPCTQKKEQHWVIFSFSTRRDPEDHGPEEAEDNRTDLTQIRYHCGDRKIFPQSNLDLTESAIERAEMVCARSDNVVYSAASGR